MNYWELKKPISNQENRETGNEFLLNLKLMNKSQGTISQYRDYLDRFFMYIEETYSDLTSETLHEWFVKQEGHLTEKSLSQRIAILSSFFKMG